MPKFIDLTGRVFSQLTVLERTARGPGAYWKCQCTCGNTCEVKGTSLTQERRPTKSCGCWFRSGKYAKIKHGHHRNGRASPELSSYNCMVDRCSNPKNKDWERYGAAGISVTPEWLGPDGFINFLKDMGPRPEGTSLDRIESKGNYTKDNCRWATHIEQSRNRACVEKRFWNGEFRTIGQLAEIAGLEEPTLRKRLQSGMSLELAMTIPLRTNMVRSKEQLTRR